jgi:uncharacterized protein involved in exopolysaccharide biosynthesis/cellulose biosynthesis protein BcsQ
VKSAGILSELIKIVGKRRYLIGAIFLVVISVVAVRVAGRKPLYEAMASISITAQTQRSTLTGEFFAWEDFYSQEKTLNTNLKIIRSYAVIERVADTLGMLQPAERRAEAGSPPSLWQRFLGLFGMAPSRPVSSPGEEYYDPAVRGIQGSVSVAPVQNTNIIEIRVRRGTPEQAVRIANTIVETFTTMQEEQKTDQTKRFLEMLTVQLVELKGKVEKAESALYAFQQRTRIVSPRSQQAMTLDEESNLRVQINTTKASKKELEARIKALRAMQSSKDVSATLPPFLQNQALRDLKSDLTKADFELRKLQESYKEKHPRVVEAKNRIALLREKMSQEVAREIAGLQSELGISSAKEGALQDSLTNFQRSAVEGSRFELEYQALEREATLNRELYNTILRRMKELNISSSLEPHVIRIVERAKLPATQIGPGMLQAMLLGVVLGLLLGIGTAIAADFLDRSVHTPQEAEEQTGHSILGMVPRLKVKTRAESLIDPAGKGPLIEAFRVLRTNLRFSHLDHPGRTFMITSPGPKEGKSTVAVNLGVTMALEGSRTLVIDTDLRHPVVHRYFGISNDRGFTNALIDLFEANLTSGSTREVSIPEIFYLVRIQNRSGTLLLKDGEDEIRFHFLGGRIADFSVTSRPESRRFGRLLIEAGKITPAQLDKALAKQRLMGRRIGHILVDMGFISPEDLLSPLRVHVKELVFRCLSLGAAPFSFLESREASPEHDIVSLMDIDELVREEIPPLEATPFLDGILDGFLKPTAYPNLMIMTSGPVPSNPTEILGSERARELIDLLKRRFDRIIVDSAPAGVVSDAVVLSPLIDGVLLVIETGRSDLARVRSSLAQLSKAKARVDGLVMTKYPGQDKHGYYYY